MTEMRTQKGRCRHRRWDRYDICFTPDNAIDEERVSLKRERPWRRWIHEVSGDVEEKEKCEQVTWTPAREHSAHDSNSIIDYHQCPALHRAYPHSRTAPTTTQSYGSTLE